MIAVHRRSKAGRFSRPFFAASTFVAEFRDDIPPVSARGLFQLPSLVLNRPTGGADPRVQRRPLASAHDVLLLPSGGHAFHGWVQKSTDFCIGQDADDKPQISAGL